MSIEGESYVYYFFPYDNAVIEMEAKKWRFNMKERIIFVNPRPFTFFSKFYNV